MGRKARQRAKSAARKPVAPKPPGARIARVAVDDATWEAFRATCGSTPASVRLGELVEADLERARGDEIDARATLRDVRERLERLERSLGT
jgi:hypothetical protein